MTFTAELRDATVDIWSQWLSGGALVLMDGATTIATVPLSSADGHALETPASGGADAKGLPLQVLSVAAGTIDHAELICGPGLSNAAFDDDLTVGTADAQVVLDRLDVDAIGKQVTITGLRLGIPGTTL